MILCDEKMKCTYSYSKSDAKVLPISKVCSNSVLKMCFDRVAMVQKLSTYYLLVRVRDFNALKQTLTFSHFKQQYISVPTYLYSKKYDALLIHKYKLYNTQLRLLIQSWRMYVVLFCL